MSFGAILLIAFGLAMDATAVAATRGLAVSHIRPRHVVLVATLFGGFQALMPLLGWVLGSRAGPTVEAWDHWIAFALLAGVGAKMLWERRGSAAEGPSASAAARADPFDARVMVLLAFATSIDAFAVGISLPLLDAPFLLSLATIGTVTALLSTLGLFAGRHFGARLGKRLEVMGGLVLMALGTMILLEHLTASQR